MQTENPHIVFSDAYSNLLSFSYAADTSIQRNFAYILGQGEGEERKKTTYFNGDEPTFLERYEVYVDAKDISGENNQSEIPDDSTGNTENIVIDSELSETSENPVQNKVITLKLKEFDSMFNEIKKLLEEIKNLIGGEVKSSGAMTVNLAGNNDSLSGKMEVTE